MEVESLTKINELTLGTSGISLKAKVVQVSEPREVKTKYGYRTQVAKATLEDDTGQIALTLWGNQFEEIGEGDTVEIKDGYITEFKGELQINVPKKGELKKV
jgi:replication factor A1